MLSTYLIGMTSDDVMGWSALLIAVLAALMTGIASGISKIREVTRREDAADYAAWKARIQEIEAEAQAFYGLLPGARQRAAEFERMAAENVKRLDLIEARLAELDRGLDRG